MGNVQLARPLSPNTVFTKPAVVIRAYSLLQLEVVVFVFSGL